LTIHRHATTTPDSCVAGTVSCSNTAEAEFGGWAASVPAGDVRGDTPGRVGLAGRLPASLGGFGERGRLRVNCRKGQAQEIPRQAHFRSDNASYFRTLDVGCPEAKKLTGKPHLYFGHGIVRFDRLQQQALSVGLRPSPPDQLELRSARVEGDHGRG